MRKMLLIVDPQVDFISGSLPVPGAAEAMDALAEYVQSRGDEYVSIVVTGDAHPANHCSFVANGGQWPAHCIAGSEGAQNWPALAKVLAQAGAVQLFKGDDSAKEEYSIFTNARSRQELAQLIEREGIEHIDICGLAGDICVAQSMADGSKIYGEDFFTLLPEYSPCIG